MRRVEKEEGWPESWRISWEYDLRELHGDRSWPGYTRAYRCRREVTLELIAAGVPAGGRVLDVAAAQGNFSLELAERGYRVTWNDLRGELEGYVRAKWERGEIVYAPGDVFGLGFGEKFDGVLAGEVIEHVAHPDRFLAALAGLVRPGGHLVVTTPNGGYFLNRLPKFSECEDPSRYEAVQFGPNSDGHLFLLHEEELRGMAEACGLEVLEVRFFANPLTCGHLKTGRLLGWLPEGIVGGIERASLRMGRGKRRLMAGLALLMRKRGGAG